GILFNCFNVDYSLLWGELNEEVKANGYQFYATFYSSPPAIKALLHGMIASGVLALIAKLYKWNDSAFFFDGTSIGAYVFALSVYVTVTVPGVRSIANPPPELDDPEEKLAAIQVLSAGNVIIALCLGMVLLLQAGQAYANHVDIQEKERVLKEEDEKKALGKQD
ncbi:Shr3 amino acid permease chaperone, partial [Flagelloscypha sp. PMI_526]